MSYEADLSKAIIWQYESAENIKALIAKKQAFFDKYHTQFWNDFYTDIFNLDTANAFGLKIWSIILDFPLFINELQSNDPRFGFASDDVNYSRGNYEPTGGLTSQFSIETQRIALKLRYLKLTGSCTVPEVNRQLQNILGISLSLVDYGDMRQAYMINTPISSELLYLLENFDILQRPSGVASGLFDNTKKYFGFAPKSANFTSNFYGGSVING